VTARPRILIVTPDFPPAHGGIQAVAHGIASNASAYDPAVVAFDAPGAEEFDSRQPFPVRRVGERPRPRALAVLRLNAAAMAEAGARRPDAVLSAHIVIAPAAWAIRRRHRLPVVQYLHADELVHRPRLARFAVRHAAATVAVSDYTRRLALGLGADPRRLHVIPPGVDAGSTAPEPRDARPTMITVGRLEDRFKGHDVVIRALPLIVHRVPDVQWIVVGEGSLRVELESAAAEAGVVEHVRFLGAVPDTERDGWLDRAHVFVMPARLPEAGAGGEGFGIAYLEAGVHRLPVVAGAVGGVLDAVSEETGVLVDPADERAVAEAVCDLLLDPDRARRLGESGHERALRHSWPVIAARVERLLLDLAEKGLQVR
jgi:phosphatidylinositol alpha-1,6-mannosyltransferase